MKYLEKKILVNCHKQSITCALVCRTVTFHPAKASR